ncbi:hypothetical protein C6P42_004736 [Pichia californica]|nr:hypothetical protein C6P42_004736 [[Candida] californica]
MKLYNNNNNNNSNHTNNNNIPTNKNINLNDNISNNNLNDLSNSNNLNSQNIPISLPLSIQQQLYPLHTFRLNYQDIISSNILTSNQAIQLLDIFRDRYGRWVSFPAMTSTEKLLKRIRNRCPLLLTVSCLLSLKYGDPLLKQKIWVKLCSIVRKEVHWLSSTYSGGLEELQCLVILSAYCIGLSDSGFQDLNDNKDNNDNNDNEPLLLLDGWHLSGIGLTLFDKINGYGLLDQMYGNEIELLWESNKLKIENKLGKNLLNNNNIIINNNRIINNTDDEEYDDDDEFNMLTLHRIWNTLVLIQLSYCLLDGRKSWVGMDRLKPRDVSNLPNATNFDFRIVAEIHIYLIGFKYILLNENFEITIKSIKIWLEKWNSTFSQPSNQFVEIDYHFVEILIRIKQLKLDISSLNLITNENLKDILDIKMHSIAIINLINTVNDDSYFAFLSDQIHLTVFYATNILIIIISAVNKFNLNNDNNTNNNSQEIDSNHDNEIIKKIQKLIFRYRTVSATTQDTFYKYYNILQNVYNSKLN